MIQLESLYLMLYSEKYHSTIAQRLNRDQGVYDYVSKHFYEWITEKIESSNIEYSKNYVIYNENYEQVGMCGSTKYHSSGVIELWYAIDYEYRNCGYAKRLVEEITVYYINHIEDLSNIKLVINTDNIYSNKVADQSGYYHVDTNRDKNIYTYFKS